MRCPYCKSTEKWRLQPMPWMGRVRPRFKNRRCSNCGHEYAVWFGALAVKHSTGRRIVFLYLCLVSVVAILLLTDLYQLAVNPDASWIHRGIEAVRGLRVSPVSYRDVPLPDSAPTAPTDLSHF